jgi:hypothetical protein
MRRRKTGQAPFLWPILLVIAGVLLLLNNYLLIELNVLDYWPVIFVLFGLQLILRGDIAPSWQAQTFGITRGSVQDGVLEISSGEIDVKMQATHDSTRLAAGQYTARSRPRLHVRNNRATISMQRGQTWLFSLADWEIDLARDLPWTVLASAHFGQIEADLRGLAVRRGYFASGLGNVGIICSELGAELIVARSTFGDVRLAIPPDVPAIIHIEASPLTRVIRHSRQYRERPDHAIVTAAYEQTNAPPVQITLSSTFGNIHLMTAPDVG